MGKQATADRDAKQDKADRAQNNAGTSEFHRVRAILDRKPDNRRKGKNDKIVLHEERADEQKRSEYGRLRPARLAKDDEESHKLQRMAEQLWVVHPHIVAEEKKDGGEEQRTNDPRQNANRHSFSSQGDQNDRRCEGNQRDAATSDDVVAQHVAQSTHEVERKRRIIVEEEQVCAGVKGRAAHRVGRVISIPAFVR